jgi:two-component system, OmpR family, response regulator AdeR
MPSMVRPQFEGTSKIVCTVAEDTLLMKRLLSHWTSMSGPLVLVVEDEPALAEVVIAYLRRDGIRALSAASAEKAATLIDTLAPDLVILDVGLPSMSGFDLLRNLRADERDIPVIMLTARVDDIDRVHGLRLGADDYVTKPFHPPELIERVHAVLRRSRPVPRRTMRFGRIVLDPRSTTCLVDDAEVALTAAEFKLLMYLAQHPNQTMTRAQLLASVLPESEAGDRVIDAHLGNVRRKLTEAGLADSPVHTLRGLGYRFDPERCM